MDKPEDKRDRLSDEEFKSIYSRVPRLCVEAVIYSKERGLLLTKRAIEPAKGLWHTPGGTVYYEDTLESAVKRIAKRELGIDVEVKGILGVLEIRFADHYYHDTSVAMLVEPLEEVARRDDAEEFGYFKALPEDLVPEMKEFYRAKLGLT